ncbi:hypothetical protein [Crateriforma conspicua]|uniref:Uncharacterized protein n=1 Tax=Crateriforma conspicua TaxID=2527996 RepID=A0A5C6G192_9PLAN|nr:hypothetical protein [Crateriforma conspicua]TWU67655.1 hypothetical protein V7x_32310 [Crateriforma conspicua]
MSVVVLECPHFLIHGYEDVDWEMSFVWLFHFDVSRVATGVQAEQLAANAAGDLVREWWRKAM